MVLWLSEYLIVLVSILLLVCWYGELTRQKLSVTPTRHHDRQLTVPGYRRSV